MYLSFFQGGTPKSLFWATAISHDDDDCYSFLGNLRAASREEDLGMIFGEFLSFLRG